jgi:hypothetical protein
VELIDLGNRFITLLDVPVRAQASRVPLTGRLASVTTLEHGKAIHQQDYFDPWGSRSRRCRGRMWRSSAI